MSRGGQKRGVMGCSMQITRRRKPKWMNQSYEERIASRDRTSAKRLYKLEAKGAIQTLGQAVKVHTCGQPTELAPFYYDIQGRKGHYKSFCSSCETFA